MGLFKKMLGYEDGKEIDLVKKNLPSNKKLQFLDVNNLTNYKVAADYILKGYPVLINFEDVDLVEANQIIYFTSGVVYALNGEVIKVTSKIILFTDEENLEDGTLRQFVSSISK